MNRKIEWHKALIITIVFYVVLALYLIWGTDILNRDYTVVGSEKIAGETLEIDMDPGRIIQQVFLADGGYLRYLDLYVTSPEAAGKFFRLMIYDETNEILYHEEVKLCDEDVYPGYVRLPVGIETIAGRAYVWQLQSTGGAMRLGWQNTGETGMTNLGYYYTITYDEVITYEAQNILMRQVYTIFPSMKKLIGLSAAVLTAALAGCFGVIWYTKKENREKCVRLQHLVWMTAAPVFYAVLLYLAYGALIQNRFGSGLADKLVYALGIGIAAFFFAYVFFAKRTGKRYVLWQGASFAQAWEENSSHWLQTAAFAGVLWGGIDYMNALYQFYQDSAYRFVLLWAGLLLLTMCPVKKIYGRLDTSCLLAAAMAALAVYRCRMSIGDGSEEVLDALLLRYEVMIGILAAVVFAALVLQIRKNRFCFRQLRFGYAALLTLLFAGLILFRNTRGWPVYMVLVFVLFYLFYVCWEEKGKMLQNFCNGVVLNFTAAVLFCMARRPIRAWAFNRYNLVFHTVTVTATYLTLVICVLTVRLLAKKKEGKKLSGYWGTLLLYGMALSFLFLTLSRTGYLAAIAVTGIIVPFTCLIVYKQSWKKFLKNAAVMAAAVLLCLPVTYSSVRLLPAVYNNPYLFELEDSAAAIHVDEAADSTKYMSISRLFKVVDEKLFSDASDVQKDLEEIMLCMRSLKDGSLYVKPDRRLYASASALEEVGEMSNGRLDIWRLYIKEWNLSGHELMGVPDERGTMIVHAHNTYLQVIHDFGMLTGLVFLVFGAVSCIMMFVYAIKKNQEDLYAILPLTVFIGFAVAGLVEWLFHPCNPIGFSVMVVFAPLLYQNGKNRKKKSLKDANE